MFPSTDIGAVQAHADALSELTGRLEPDAVPLPEAPGMWVAFDRIERLAAGAKLLLGQRVNDSGVWQLAGDRDAGVWMARHAGGTVTAARVGLAASKRLAGLSETAGALRRGELSVSQAVPIADAAYRKADAERRLLGLAGEASVGELRDECGRVKAKADPDPEETHRRIRANRRLRQGTNSDGAWSLWGTGPVEDGNELNAVLGPIVDEIFREAHNQGRQESREAYMWDALLELARRAHQLVYSDDVHDHIDSDDDLGNSDHIGDSDDIDSATGHDDDVGYGYGGVNADRRNESGDRNTDSRGDSGARDDASNSGAGPSGASDRNTGSGSGAGRADDGDSPADRGPAARPAADATTSGREPGVRKPRRYRRKRMNEKYMALLRVDIEALTRGAVDGNEICEIGGTPVPVSVARQVLGNAVLKLVITKGQDVLSVTHLGRGPTAAQKIALRWLSPTCTVLGCNRTDLEHDHRIDWHITRHTRLDQLDDLCSHHHDLKTRKGWALVPGKGPRAMVPPSDPRHPHHNPASTTPSTQDPTTRPWSRGPAGHPNRPTNRRPSKGRDTQARPGSEPNDLYEAAMQQHLVPATV